MKPSSSISENRLLTKIAASRFFTFSLVIHVGIVLMLGSAVLFHAQVEVPDFASGDGESFLSETTEPAAAPPQAEQVIPDQVFTPTAPSVNTPNVSSITAVTQQASFSMPSTANLARTGVADGMKGAMSSVGSDQLGKSLQTGMGNLRTARIFGKEIKASKLGVILDVSGSAHPHLAGTIKEIQKAFPDALLVLYPGCGMADDRKTVRDFEIMKFSSVPKDYIDVNQRGTGKQVANALKIKEFKSLTRRSKYNQNLYVAMYPANPQAEKRTSHMETRNMISHTEVAFDYLIKEGVDTIYWFADFADKIESDVANDVLRSVRSKKITVHLNSFAGKQVPEEAKMLTDKTGGTITTDMGKKK